MHRKLFLISVLVAALIVGIPTMAASENEIPTFWKTIADTDSIVIGRLSLDAEIEREIREGNAPENYVTLNLTVKDILKGSKLRKKQQIRYYVSESAHYGPPASDLVRLLERDCMVFFGYSEGDYYFSFGSDVILDMKSMPEEGLKRITDEIVRQQSIIDS